VYVCACGDSNGDAITRSFEFTDFKQAWIFMSQIAHQAEEVCMCVCVCVCMCVCVCVVVCLSSVMYLDEGRGLGSDRFVCV